LDGYRRCIGHNRFNSRRKREQRDEKDKESKELHTESFYFSEIWS
jgi:hypothetical protein